MDRITWTNEKRKISDLSPAEYNPRQLTEKQAKDLDASLERFNLCDPIIINADNKIIGGHQRINILKRRGAVDVDVRVPSRQLTEHEEKELNLRLNKNLGEWDFDLLAGFDQEMLLDVGFDSAELDKMFQLEPDAKDDEVPEAPETPISKTGDIWLLGRHRVMCGDSTKIDDVEKLMDGKKADMVFTDPPYGISLDTDTEKKLGKTAKAKVYDRIIGDGIDYDARHIFDFFGYVDEILIWGADYFIDTLPNFGKDGNLIVWDKRVTGHEDKKNYASEFELCWSKNKRAKRIYKHDWVRFFGMQKEDQKKRLHPNQKPTALLVDIMPKDKNLVVDLFLGSGSTLIACEKTNRICYGMEIDPKYCDVIVKRWEDFTGQKAELCGQ